MKKLPRISMLSLCNTKWTNKPSSVVLLESDGILCIDEKKFLVFAGGDW
jgi:hypothetical protein